MFKAVSVIAIFELGMPVDLSDIFNIDSTAEFESFALEIFKYQYLENDVYNRFCSHLKVTDKTVKSSSEIPFLPINFFKFKEVISGNDKINTVFTSSGTTNTGSSKHYVTDIKLYRTSYLTGFEFFYGEPSDYCILALLPSYLERGGSSLIFMVDDLIKKSSHADSGFYLNDYEKLCQKLVQLEGDGIKTLLIGVSFALLELVEQFQFNLKHTVVMETGGMKGRRKEIVREELHQRLKKGFGVEKIHSEYGMTELLSQAYSKGDGVFYTPPWMKIMTRDTEDPFGLARLGKTGGINIIDLANIHSCSFIATQDLGKLYRDGSFEVLGRFDHSDIRGCNLMVF